MLVASPDGGVAMQRTLTERERAREIYNERRSWTVDWMLSDGYISEREWAGWMARYFLRLLADGEIQLESDKQSG